MATAIEAPAAAEGLVQHTQFQFSPPTRRATFPRIGVDGISGSGRTRTGLEIARGLGYRIAVIDTNGGASARYAAEVEFQMITPTRFDPDDLFTALAAAAVSGNDVVVVDVFSAYWSGVGGMLEKVDRDAQAKGGTVNAAWSLHRPSERRLWGAIKAYPGSVVLLMNSKVDTVLESDGEGGHVVRQIPVRPDQRDGLAYDLTFLGSMRDRTFLDVVKSPIPLGPCVKEPGEELGTSLLGWAQDGEPSPLGLDLVRQARSAELTLTGLVDLWADAVAARALDMAVLDVAGKVAMTLLELLVQRSYEHMGARGVTAQGLRTLWGEVAEAQAQDMPVLHQGRPTTLGILLQQRGKTLAAQEQKAEAAAQRAEATRAVTQPQQQRPQPPAQGAAAEQDRAAEWPAKSVDWSTALPPKADWPAEPPPVNEEDLAELERMALGNLADLTVLEHVRQLAEERGVLHEQITHESGETYRFGDLLDGWITDLRADAQPPSDGELYAALGSGHPEVENDAADMLAGGDDPSAWPSDGIPFHFSTDLLDVADAPPEKAKVERLALVARRGWHDLLGMDTVKAAAEREGLMEVRVTDEMFQTRLLGELLNTQILELRQRIKVPR